MMVPRFFCCFQFVSGKEESVVKKWQKGGAFLLKTAILTIFKQ